MTKSFYRLFLNFGYTLEPLEDGTTLAINERYVIPFTLHQNEFGEEVFCGASLCKSELEHCREEAANCTRLPGGIPYLGNNIVHSCKNKFKYRGAICNNDNSIEEIAFALSEMEKHPPEYFG